MQRRVTPVLACLIAACGFGGNGLGGGDQGTDDGGPTLDATSEGDVGSGQDASDARRPMDAMVDAPSRQDGAMDGPPVDSSMPCLDAIPMGWSLMLSEMSSTACPDGTTPAPAIANPMALAGACTCACSVTNPSCGYGNISIMVGTSGCTTNSGLAADGSCVGAAGSHVLAYHQISPLAPQGGSCAWNATPNAADVTSTALALCNVTIDREAVCEGTVPGGFTSCIATAGDMSCSAPFPNKTLVYDPMPGLQCGSCGSCTVSATCSGSLNFYNDGSCTQLVVQAPADGSCDMIPNHNGAAFNSWNYTSGVSANCSGSPSSAPTLMTSNERTICCR
jgi:hypothetical protein